MAKEEKKERSLFSEKGFEIFNKYGIFIILLILMLFMTIMIPGFLSTRNIFNIMRQMSIKGLLALGVTLIIITGGIDLSSGAVVAFASVVTASFAQPGDSFLLAIIVGLGAGALAGLINGTIISKAKIPPFIATLGMMQAARGVALLYSGGRPIGNLSEAFEFIGGGDILGLPVPIIIFSLLIIITHLILSQTKLGKSIYAIGGNEEAAYICGINVPRVKLIIYTYAGLLAGLGAIILTSRISSGQPTAGLTYEMDAIAGTVIGGTSLSGGIGSIGGTVVGVMIIGVLNNGLDLMNVSSYWQQILKGVIIVTAIIIDVWKRKRQ